MFKSCKITSRLYPWHRSLLIQCNLTSHNSEQQEQSILNNKHIKTLIIRWRYFNKNQDRLDHNFNMKIAAMLCAKKNVTLTFLPTNYNGNFHWFLIKYSKISFRDTMKILRPATWRKKFPIGPAFTHLWQKRKKKRSKLVKILLKWKNKRNFHKIVTNNIAQITSWTFFERPPGISAENRRKWQVAFQNECRCV